MSRQDIIDTAAKYIGNPSTDDIWRDVLKPSDYQPGIRLAWCGAFALHCLHGAGMAADVKWIFGKGFLGRLPITRDPQPGDIAYFDKPFQHHAIVERVDGDTLHTIDGNQGNPQTCKRVTRPVSHGVYYSVAQWLPKTEPAPPPGPSIAEVQHALNTAMAGSAGSPSLAPLNGRLLTVDGELSEATKAALSWFQGYNGLPFTGEIDAATLKALGL